MYDFGELIKSLRNDRGYTQAQLAKKINKSKSTVCRYESNQKMPSLETLIDISVLFHVSLDYLTGIEKKKSISIHDLTPGQADVVDTLLIEFQRKDKMTHVGLTQRQLHIVNALLIEFLK